MPRRLCRVVTTLGLLAAAITAPAADDLVIANSRFNLHATISTEELHVEGPAAAGAGAAAAGAAASPRHTVIVVGGGRANAQAKALDLKQRGLATRVDPVLYLNGRTGDPASRVIATRRILVQAADGTSIADLAAAHGLRLVKAVKGENGWWIAEPISGDVYAALDAAAALAADPRAVRAAPILQPPRQAYHEPNDPAYLDGHQWHLNDPAVGINVTEVWDEFKGDGTNIAITDTGTELTHEDLYPSAKIFLSYDYFNDDADPKPSPTDDEDNHGTAVAGTAAARGDNGKGVAGVAFKAGIISSKILNRYDRNAIGGSSIAPSDRVRDALTAWINATRTSDLTWVNNNSWGPVGAGGPDDLETSGLDSATRYGRTGRGVPMIFAAGNDGEISPRIPQLMAGFNGYLNRFTIGVAALGRLRQTAPANNWHHATYSSIGPNITISAPGGDHYNSQTAALSAIPLGISTTDRTGDMGYINDNPTPLPPPADFNDDDIITTTPGPQVPPDPHPASESYENGAYIPPGFNLSGTSFAAPVVSGGVALMLQSRPDLSYRDIRQLMMHRGQDRVPSLIPFVPQGVPWPVDDWGLWHQNAVNLSYCMWYGFGAIDMGRFIYGGGGTRALATDTTALNEPGSLRWPLLPKLLDAPLTYSRTFPLPLAGATSDPTALFDAPYDHFVGADEANIVSTSHVWNGRKFEGIGDRRVLLTMPITDVPARFRVDTVEVTVTLSGVGTSTYPSSVWPRASTTPSFDWGQYEYRLTSPSGSECILGRERPGSLISKGAAPFTWTFSEVFHTNETADGDWVLAVIDQVNNIPNNATLDPDNLNPPEARVSAVKLAVYGHQTYRQPSLDGVSANGLPSGSGTQTIVLDGDGFGLSQGGISVAQGYWYPDDLTTAPVELETTYISNGQVSVKIPQSLLPTATPGQGFVAIANPAVVVGRSGTDPATAVDMFDDPYPVTPLPSNNPRNPERYMKRCPDGDAKRIRYSRPPTMTPFPDVEVDGKKTVVLTTFVGDPDVEANLPVADPETLTVTATTFNPGMTGKPVITQVTPDARGLGTYSIAVPVLSDASAFAIVQVAVTDGVTTTIRTFRIVNPTELEATGCGGGMGLALIGVPLCAWLIRRRRR